MEPTSDNERQLADRVIARLAMLSPDKVMPTNRMLGEELTRAVTKRNTRHRVLRLIASQYVINGAPADASTGSQYLEEDLAREITKTSARVERYKDGAIPEILGELATDYFEQYMDNQAALSRWLLFCAIATAPGDLAGEDATDRGAFQAAIADWLGVHADRYAEAYGALLGQLGRRDRADDEYLSLAQALGMLAEGAILRASVDPTIYRADAARIFRQAALGLVAVFTARAADERTIDDLFREVLSPDPDGAER